ncbi:MAG: mechanosensitive ion channel family protein [Nevskiaceae bacterium]|nr:MAG: mechanosensitive ion channel family protein [Nevskiaceae bacterium]
MQWLHEVTFLHNPLIDWLAALGIALAINLVVGVGKWLIVHKLAAIAARTDTVLDDAIVDVARRTRQWLVFGVTLYAGSRYLDLPEHAEKVLHNIAIVAAFLQLGGWLRAALDFWLERYRRHALAHDAGAATSLAALSFIGRLLLWAVILLLMLDNLGINVTALVAGLGVGGIAVALAVQNILGDLFASLSIVMDKPFVIGDSIVVDSYAGTVEHVGLKTTRVRSTGGEQLVFSNSDLLKARLRNFKRMQERRIVFTVGVLYDTPPDTLAQIPGIVKEVVSQAPKVRFDRAHLRELGDSALVYEIVYWVQEPDYVTYMDAQQAINLGLLRRFAAAGIGFAYPTQSLHIEGPVRVESAASAARG